MFSTGAVAEIAAFFEVPAVVVAEVLAVVVIVEVPAVVVVVEVPSLIDVGAPVVIVDLGTPAAEGVDAPAADSVFGSLIFSSILLVSTLAVFIVKSVSYNVLRVAVECGRRKEERAGSRRRLALSVFFIRGAQMFAF